MKTSHSVEAVHRGWCSVHGIAIVVFMAAAGLFPVLRIWPLLWLVPLTLYGAMVVRVQRLRDTFQPWVFGHFGRSGTLAALAIAVGASGVLVAFHHMQKPPVGQFAEFLPVSWLGSVLGFGAIFSLFNALLEEVIFRGIVFDALESEWGARECGAFWLRAHAGLPIRAYGRGARRSLWRLPGVAARGDRWTRLARAGSHRRRCDDFHAPRQRGCLVRTGFRADGCACGCARILHAGASANTTYEN